jgi:hypothetical protein
MGGVQLEQWQMWRFYSVNLAEKARPGLSAASKRDCITPKHSVFSRSAGKEEGHPMTEFDQTRIAHMQMIQNVITRMAGNSFALKTLAVTLTTGVIALLGAIQKPNPFYMLAALLPILMFWWLDTRYLQLERLYRRLYDDVRLGKMNEPFCMDTRAYRDQVASVVRIAVSWSVIGIYAALVCVLGIVAAGIKTGG